VSLTETIYACDRVLICFVFQLFVWYSCVLVVAGMTSLGLGARSKGYVFCENWPRPYPFLRHVIWVR
jgi:hypothetical protein